MLTVVCFHHGLVTLNSSGNTLVQEGESVCVHHPYTVSWAMEKRAASQGGQQLQHRQQHIWQYETGFHNRRMRNFWGHEIIAIFVVGPIPPKISFVK